MIGRVLVASLLALAAVPLMPAQASPVSPRPRGPVKHFVIMTQSGHSYDNYLRDWKGADGAKDVPCQAASPASPCIAPFALAHAHSRTAMRTGAVLEAEAVDGGRMDGFVRAQHTRDGVGALAMGYYRASDVPVLGSIVRHGVLFDHWFAGVPGGTVANRLFGVTARPPGDVRKIPSSGWPTDATIFDRLDAAGVPWRIYVQSYAAELTVDTASQNQRLGGQLARVPVLAMPRYLHNPRFLSHIVDLSNYYADATSGRLPAVSFVVSTTQSEQAPQPPANGQKLARSVLNALIASRDWYSSAFLLQYDSGGGFYDHVPPPILDGARAGIRVPAVLVSPFARAGTVNHSVHDAASVLRFIEQNWRLPPLAARDRNAAGLSDALTSSAARTTPALIATTTVAAPRQPARIPLYVGYLAAIVVAAAVVCWTSARTVQRRRA